MEQMTRVQQNTLRKIVEAAIELMSEKGFHRVSVQEVGKKAGICEKTVFRYFATKKSLLDEIIRFRAYLSALDSVDTNGDDFLRDPRELHSFLCDYMGAMQEKGKVREGDVGLMVRAFVNTLHGYMLMYCLNDDSKAWQDKVASMKLTIGLFIQGFSRQCTSCGA